MIMQATKAQSLHSPGSKSCRPQQQNGAAPVGGSTSSNGNGKSDSLAQRVMEASNGVTTNCLKKTDSNTSNKNNKLGDRPPSPLNIEEIDSLTRRAAKLTVEVNNSSIDKVGDPNNNSNNKRSQQNKQLAGVKDATSSSSPSLLLDGEPISPTTLQATSSSGTQPNSFNSLNMALEGSTLVAGNESVFKQAIISTKSATSNVNTNDVKGTRQGIVKHLEFDSGPRISLDTRVPHPSKANEFASTNIVANEEVSYYNEAAGLTLKKETTKAEQQKATKLSVVVNGDQSGLRKQVSNGGSSHRSINLKLEQQQSRGEYMNASLEDDYATRYDNALMLDESEERPYEQANEQSSHNETSDSKTRYEDLIGCSMSTPNSPKAKSAPATPCNVTPTAFHQNTSHLNSMLHPSPANTLPPDIRKNISSTCRVLPVGATMNPRQQHQVAVGSEYLDELLKRGQSLLDANEYQNAIGLFTQCIELAKSENFPYLERNFKVYSQRAEAYYKMGNFDGAIDDSRAARDLNPNYTQAYYLQGQAQLQIGQHADALASFSFGLTRDTTNESLFQALVEAARKSSFSKGFEPKYEKLRSMHLADKPFVVVSVLGQELIIQGHPRHAIVILESALKLGPENNKKFRGSVLASIAYAYCTTRDYEKALVNMQAELDLERDLEDVNGQCRVLSNIGYIYYKMRKFDKSLESHRRQMTLAMRAQLFQQVAIALNALGHIHVARNDFRSAITSHTRCLEILRQLNEDELSQAKELLAIGHVHCMLNEFRAAKEKYDEAIGIIEMARDHCRPEDYYYAMIMAYFNLGYLALKCQSFQDAKLCYLKVIEKAANLSYPRQTIVEMRACNGLGHAHRLFKNFEGALSWFDRQRKLAEQLKDLQGQSQALCNLGMTYQHFKNYKAAWDMFETNQHLASQDHLLKAYAYSYIGSMYFLESRYTEALQNYETSKNLFTKLEYCTAETKTVDLNMAAVSERLGSHIELPNVTNQKKVIMA